MKAELFDYALPDELVAQRPPSERDGARMLVLGRRGLEHRRVRELAELIPEGALVVLNETRVRRARLFCRRPALGAGGGGGKVELLLLGPTPAGTWRALGRANRPLRPGDRIEPERPSLELGWLEVAEREEDGTLVVRGRREDGSEAAVDAIERCLEERGCMPLPPYVRRAADAADAARYQTVFAQQLGSVAAPTAGLHLTERAFERLAARGVDVGRLVLHVGVGTFRPVSAEDFDEHDMHSEELEVSAELAERIAQARARNGRVVAIGTTAVRALEAAADPHHVGYIRPFSGATRLMIQPGYQFRVVDALLTNFHMPRSTLLALVSAFAGRARVLEAYQTAIAERYRFLSYGDAMWLPERLS